MISGTLSGAPAVLSSLAKVQKQIAFAGSQALNDTARDIQHFTLKTELPSKFTLRARGNPWQTPGTKLGFNIKFANRDNLMAVIGSQAEWLDEQEKGGLKTVTGGHRAAIPTENIKQRREIMARQRKPRQLLAGRIPPGYKTKAFMSPPGSKLYPGIYVRTGEGRQLKILFGLQSEVRIRPLLEFEKHGIAEGERVYNRHFNARLSAALATMR